ncbi:protein of unknown function [Microbacterium sp. Nx66]|nr:protein of unknown function [Microbacterium sp. Nx66]
MRSPSFVSGGSLRDLGQPRLLGPIDDRGERLVEEAHQDGPGLDCVPFGRRLADRADELLDGGPVHGVLRMLGETTDLRPEALDGVGARGVALDPGEARRRAAERRPERDDVPLLHRRRHVVGQLDEVGHIVVLDDRHDVTDRADPDVAEQVDRVPHALQIDRGHAGVPVPLHLDEAVVGQAVEGMTDRRLRGAEAFGEFVIAQALAGLEFAADDGILQAHESLVAHRPAFEGAARECHTASSGGHGE